MKYHEKLRLFFKASNLSQKEVAERLEVSPSMLSRYFKGSDKFAPDFIVKLIKEFPEIDLQYIFSEEDENNIVSETIMNYTKKEIDVVKELELIEEKITEIKNYLAQNCHKK